MSDETPPDVRDIPDVDESKIVPLPVVEIKQSDGYRASIEHYGTEQAKAAMRRATYVKKGCIGPRGTKGNKLARWMAANKRGAR